MPLAMGISSAAIGVQIPPASSSTRREAAMKVGKFWPDDTFVWENGSREHYCGTHWEPFFGNPEGISGIYYHPAGSRTAASGVMKQTAPSRLPATGICHITSR